MRTNKFNKEITLMELKRVIALKFECIDFYELGWYREIFVPILIEIFYFTKRKGDDNEFSGIY